MIVTDSQHESPHPALEILPIDDSWSLDLAMTDETLTLPEAAQLPKATEKAVCSGADHWSLTGAVEVGSAV